MALKLNGWRGAPVALLVLAAGAAEAGPLRCVASTTVRGTCDITVQAPVSLGRGITSSVVELRVLADPDGRIHDARPVRADQQSLVGIALNRVVGTRVSIEPESQRSGKQWMSVRVVFTAAVR